MAELKHGFPDGPEPALIRRLEPLGRLVERYFQSEVRGIERVPEGPCLLVGNHSGGVTTPESWILGLAWYRHTGWDQPLYALAHDTLFKVPGVARALRLLGGVPASRENAERYLRTGHTVLVYPGGDWETHRPGWMSGRIDFGGRKGFIQTAMELGVPVVPVVTAGSHEGWYVLTRGEGIARALRLDQLFRIKVFPVALGLPTGLVLGPASVHLPLPHPVLVEFLEPMRPEGDPEAAYQAVVETMQARLDVLTAELRRRKLRRRSR